MFNIWYSICVTEAISMSAALLLALFSLPIAVIFKDKTYIPKLLKISGTIIIVSLLFFIAGYFISTSLLVG